MSPEFRSPRDMPDELLEHQLNELEIEQGRRLTEEMKKAQAEIDDLLKRYPKLGEGEILRVALGKRQAEEVGRYVGHTQRFGSVSISHVQNIYPDPEGKEGE